MTKIFGNDMIWRILATGLMTILIGIGSWGLLAVAEMPKSYISKSDYNVDKKELHQQLYEMKEDINNKIQGMKKDFTKQQDNIDRKIDSIINILIERREGTEDSK